MGKYVKKVGKNYQVETPVGDLIWVTTTGQGKLNTLNDKYYYQATLLLPEDSEECKTFIAEIQEFWKENAPKKFAKKGPNSTGYKPNMVNSDEMDEDGDPIKVPDGNIAFAFKTETTFKDGNQKKVHIFNSKGAKVSLGTKAIGNGSRGRIQGIITTYEQPASAGCSLYLNGIQLSKFVEFTGGPSFDSIEDEDGDGFEGFEDGMDALEEESGTEKTATERPRL